MAQNGIDQTKSAEVSTRVNPGMPSKIGGWPVKLKYQLGSNGPSGAIGGDTLGLMKPAIVIAWLVLSNPARPRLV
jgi:hypothetical protein